MVATQPRGAHVVGALDHPMILECDTAAAPQGTGQMWRTRFKRRYVTIVGKLPNPRIPTALQGDRRAAEQPLTSLRLIQGKSQERGSGVNPLYQMESE